MVSKATFRQWETCAMVAAIGFIYGCENGWLSAAAAISVVSDEWPVSATKERVNRLASISLCASVASVWLGYQLVDGRRLGRKPLMSAGAALYMAVGTLAAAAFASSFEPIAELCALACAAVNSLQYAVCGVYIAEVASARNRELICAFFQLSVAVGVEAHSCFASSGCGSEHLGWLPLLASALALAASSRTLESPHYLASRGEDEPAADILCYLNNRVSEFEAQRDLQVAKKYVNEAAQRSGGPADLKLGLVLIAVNGLSVVHCYCLIGRTGCRNVLEHVAGSLDANSFVILRILCSACSLVTVAKFHRRSLFLFGYCAAGFVQLVLAFCYRLRQQNGNSSLWLAYAILFWHFVFLIIVKTTFAVALEIFKIEVFPYALKGFYTSLVTCSTDCFKFALIKSHFYTQPLVGNSPLIAVYACISFFLAAVTFFFVQDTKGKTLLQIRTQLNSSVTQRTPLLQKKPRKL